MKIIAVSAIAIAMSAGLLAQQEQKPVPKDSARVSVPGCSKGYVFTAGSRTVDEPGSGGVPEGMHLRMNGDRKLINEIKAHEGSLIEITGLMKKGQHNPGGVGLGGGISVSGNAGVNQAFIDVESWRQLSGGCPPK
jgi:hypothetical protein